MQNRTSMMGRAARTRVSRPPASMLFLPGKLTFYLQTTPYQTRFAIAARVFNFITRGYRVPR